MKQVFIVMSIILISTFNLHAQNESNGKISGYMFGGYFYNVARDPGIAGISNSALNGEKDFQGFAFRRIYFTYDYTISSDFSTRFRIEADQKGNVSNDKFGLAIKDAYLKWKNIFDGSDLIVGLQPTPAFGASEFMWGYRSLEKTIMDLRGIVLSRDLGIALKGKLACDGMWNYWIEIGNNSGNKSETDKYKRFYAHVDFRPTKNLRFTLYGDYNVRPERDDPNSITDPKATLSNNILTTAFFAGYQEKDKFSIGVEGFYRTQKNGVIFNQSMEDLNAFGISLFGSYDLSEKFSVIGRYDYYDPVSNSFAEGDSRNYVILGMSYRPDPKVAIMPNIQFESYEKLPNGTEFDNSMTARITVYYEFL